MTAEELRQEELELKELRERQQRLDKYITKNHGEAKFIYNVMKEIYYNYIGSFENDALNYGEEYLEKEWAFKDRTCRNVCQHIYDEIVKGKEKWLFYGNLGIERKHIKFLGKELLEDLIGAVVVGSYNEGGWDFKENFYGDFRYRDLD